MFVAEANGHFVGSAGVFVDADGWPHVWGMWVTPTLRGQGLGTALLSAATDFAESSGHGLLRLGVADSNPRVFSFYRRFGFEETGRKTPLDRDPSIMEVEMELTPSMRGKSMKPSSPRN